MFSSGDLSPTYMPSDTYGSSQAPPLASVDTPLLGPICAPTHPSTHLSAWHDIPLGLERTPDGGATLWTLVEIPEGDQAKYETMVRAPGG
jgi:hypothetical protein